MVKIVKTSYMAADLGLVNEIYRIIRDCGIIVGSTDTLYGIFANPYMDECVEKVFEAKKRPGKPIPVLASSINAVLSVISESDVFIEKILDIFWPGPVTFVLDIDKDKDIFPENIHMGTYTVGFRVPASPLARKIAEYNGGFITGTSANISGRKPAREIIEAVHQLGEKINLYIDSGPAPIGSPSTVIRYKNGNIYLIREGALSIRAINTIIRYVRATY